MSEVVVYTPGVWDMLHVGHVRFLRTARGLGDRLVVGICSDELVRHTKGTAPIYSDVQRKEILQAVRFVDDTLIYFDVDQTKSLIGLHVSVFAVGPEFGVYAGHRDSLKTCELNGIDVVTVPRTSGISTTKLRTHNRVPNS